MALPEPEPEPWRDQRAGQHLGRLLLRAAVDQRHAGRGDPLGELAEQAQVAGAGVGELGRQRDLAADRRARVAQAGLDAVHHAARCARGGDDDDLLAVQQVLQQHRLGRRRELVVALDLLLQGAVLVVGRFELGAQRARGPVQRGQRRPAQLGRAEHDPHGQGQEDGDDRNQVVTKINHVKSPVSQEKNECHVASKYRIRMGSAGEAATATNTVTAAASASTTRDQLEIRLR